MPSFDIVSEVNHHELTNAVDQTAREIDNRFDFKGSSSKIEQTENEVMLYGDNDFQLEQIKVILLTKAAKRDLDALSFEFHEPQSNQANMNKFQSKPKKRNSRFDSLSSDNSTTSCICPRFSPITTFCTSLNSSRSLSSIF